MLPTNFRMGQLYRHGGARDCLSSVGWVSPDKPRRTLGGRLAQQVAKVVTYDTGYGFSLSEKIAATPMNLEVSSDYQDPALERISQDWAEVLTMFTASADARAQNRNLGAGVAWRDQGRWRVKGHASRQILDHHRRESFRNRQCSGKSRFDRAQSRGTTHGNLVSLARSSCSYFLGDGISTIASQGYYDPLGATATSRMYTENKASTRRRRGGRNGCCLDPATRAARRQARQLRSASLCCVQQSVRETKPTLAKMNKYLGDSRKSATARYLQLKSGYGVTGIHHFRMKKAQDARCWWCNGSSQSVTHLMFECRKRRRAREVILRAISPKKTKISARMNKENLGILFGDASIEVVLRFTECTAVRKRKEADGAQRNDEWDIGLLGRESDGDWGG